MLKKMSFTALNVQRKLYVQCFSVLAASAVLGMNTAHAGLFDPPTPTATPAVTPAPVIALESMAEQLAGTPNIELSNYKLGAGDVVTIRVFGEDELSRERIRLTDAGTLQYPVLGEIVIKGMTIGDLQRVITEGLRGRYLVNPLVAVLLDEYRPYYINGMVYNAGGFPFRPGLTVLKAIALSGGFKERASKEKIYIIRADDPTQSQQRVELNSPVYPGDIITVQDSFF
jgi:protein involved in polysaccharide export with SLBB domain